PKRNNTYEKSNREGHEFHSCRFKLREKMRLPAAEVTLAAFTALFSSRNLFPHVLNLASPSTLRRRKLCPITPPDSLSLPSRRPLRPALLRPYARSCPSFAHSRSGRNHRARCPADQGRVLP